MALRQAFISTSGKVWKKVEASDGRIMHFADGTPKSEHAFKSTYGRWKAYDGQPAKVAVPSKKGPGFERKEINPIEASAFGQELYWFWENEEYDETVLIDGEEYRVEDLAELNERIIERYNNSDIVFRYT